MAHAADVYIFFNSELITTAYDLNLAANLDNE